MGGHVARICERRQPEQRHTILNPRVAEKITPNPTTQAKCAFDGGAARLDADADAKERTEVVELVGETLEPIREIN